MANRSILTFPDQRLKRKSQSIIAFDHELRSLVHDMLDTLEVQMGAGLAAPQIGVQLRVMIVRCDSFDYVHPTADELHSGMLVLVNPELELSGKKMTWEESCLSVPGYRGEVKRSAFANVKYSTIDGKEQEINATWPLSGALQHECDHLAGILYIDRNVDLKRKICSDMRESHRRLMKVHRRAKKEARLERIANFDPRTSHGFGKRRKKKRKKR